MRSFKYTDFEGNKKILKQIGEDSALPYITRRIEYFMPKETVEVDKLKKTIESISVDVQRNITPQEANMMVDNIKNFIIGEIDGAEKFYVSREAKNK